QADSADSPLPFQPNLDGIEKLLRQAPPDGGFKPPPDVKPRPADQTLNSPPSNAPPENPARAAPRMPPPPEPSLEEKGDALRKGWADWWTDTFAGSEALRNLGRKLSQPLAGSDRGTIDEGLLEKLEHLGSYIPFKNLFARSSPRPQLPSTPRPAAS